MNTIKTRFTAKQLSKQLDAINQSLGLSFGDIGSLETSVQGGAGTAVEMISCEARSVIRMTNRTTPRKAYDALMTDKVNVLQRMKDKRNTYRGNSRHVMSRVEQHVIDCTGSDTLAEAREKVLQAWKEFDYPINQRNIPNNQARFSDWLWGLPFNFEYVFHDINCFLDTLSLAQPRKEPTSKQVGDLYHNLIFKVVFS
jgi:hypothetical protein